MKSTNILIVIWAINLTIAAIGEGEEFSASKVLTHT